MSVSLSVVRSFDVGTIIVLRIATKDTVSSVGNIVSTNQ